MSGHNAEPACDAMPEYLQAYRVALVGHARPSWPLYQLAQGPVSALECVGTLARAMAASADDDPGLLHELALLADEAAQVWWRALKVRQRVEAQAGQPGFEARSWH